MPLSTSTPLHLEQSLFIFYLITFTALVTSYFFKWLFWHIKHTNMMCFYNSHCLTVYTIQLKSFVNKSICQLTKKRNCCDNENLSWFQFNTYGHLLLFPLLIWIVKGIIWVLDCWLDKTNIVKVLLWVLSNCDSICHYFNIFFFFFINKQSIN